jgi:hypothetical protein
LLLASLLVIILSISFGCGSPSPAGDQGETADSGGTPELTDDVIRRRINDTGVYDVPEENGKGDPISWNFDEDEPKEIEIVDKQVDGNEATIVLNMTTSSPPRRRNPRQLSGQIRTHWKLETGWVMRRWEIEYTENISMKYKNLPPKDPQTPSR